jgi:hypothetical protein
MFVEKLILNLIRPTVTVQPTEDKNDVSKIAAKVVMTLLDIAIFIIAIVVSWDCNSKTTGVVKFIFILYAALFPTTYLSFYLIYRIILNNPCY